MQRFLHIRETNINTSIELIENILLRIIDYNEVVNKIIKYSDHY